MPRKEKRPLHVALLLELEWITRFAANRAEVSWERGGDTGLEREFREQLRIFESHIHVIRGAVFAKEEVSHVVSSLQAIRKKYRHTLEKAWREQSAKSTDFKIMHYNPVNLLSTAIKNVR